MKTFEQPLIAAKPGVQMLPALSFSYFDPNTRKYEIARSAPLSVTISPSQADSTLTASQVAASAGLKGDKSAQTLRADHPEGPARNASLVPLYLQPKFLAVPLALVLAFSAAWAAARRRQRSEEQGATSYARIPSKTTKRVLAQMEAAARAKNTAVFFELARSALQRLYAARWQLRPAEITSVEIEARLAGDEDVRELFAYADESKYSGRELQATHFGRWLNLMRERLNEESAE
jgi:hypothetical protein